MLGDPGRQPAAHVEPRGAHRRPSSSVSGHPSPSSSTLLRPCQVVLGRITRTRSSRTDWTANGTWTARLAVRTSKRYRPDLPPGACSNPAARAGAAGAGLGLADAPHLPGVTATRVHHEEAGVGCRLHGARRRSGRERHDLDAALAAERAAVGGLRRQWRGRGSDVAGLVARAGDDDVRAGREARAVLAGAVPRPDGPPRGPGAPGRGSGSPCRCDRRARRRCGRARTAAPASARRGGWGTSPAPGPWRPSGRST